MHIEWRQASGVESRKLLVYVDKETEPTANVASENRIFGQVERLELPQVLRFWKNTECLIRGRARSQKYGWYNEELAAKLKVPVIERSTGGGVVYNDLGNLNWSFFLQASGDSLSPATLFEKASACVVEALRRGGFDARFSPPNRIDVSGRKVSGMAARSTRTAHLVHGTLLIDTDLERLNLLCVAPAGCPPVSNLKEWQAESDEEVLEVAIVERLDYSGYEVTKVDSLQVG
jgi:lipoate-protein ligase A